MWPPHHSNYSLEKKVHRTGEAQELPLKQPPVPGGGHRGSYVVPEASAAAEHFPYNKGRISTYLTE